MTAITIFCLLLFLASMFYRNLIKNDNKQWQIKTDKGNTIWRKDLHDKMGVATIICLIPLVVLLISWIVFGIKHLN